MYHVLQKHVLEGSSYARCTMYRKYWK